ncbi:heme ABC transporter ATP-binding protein [Allonocardiopsis opalescens]|uniref:Iron complex transport system ATP-binding protein n=1 Tax=Allonocardiopsis opalescens TaxID=1144618 RepID=A0A2T0Q967_9ACTN|nr:heme ABC transporter ATP-binding protein [Allonocardiopsis opalescens]PRY00387.1 iron complex transport system ATP-binding protein [Allonocardiopsis opalescens]
MRAGRFLPGGRRADAPPHRTPPGEAALTGRGLTVRYGARTVLDGVDADVRAGEVLALVGPNGAGKSTLLSVLAGDLAPASGTVRVHKRPLERWPVNELARRRAVLPQHGAVAFSFTVAEVVAMGRAPWAGTPAAADDDRAVAGALAATATAELAGRRVPTLSGGERARVALARVLAQAAPVLLLDEPTAALDLRHQELVLRIAREHAAAGDAVAVVLHDLGLAAAYADRVAVISRGRIAANGPPATVFSADLLSEVYRHEVEVLPHPRTGAPIVLPVR